MPSRISLLRTQCRAKKESRDDEDPMGRETVYASFVASPRRSVEVKESSHRAKASLSLTSDEQALNCRIVECRHYTYIKGPPNIVKWVQIRYDIS